MINFQLKFHFFLNKKLYYFFNRNLKNTIKINCNKKFLPLIKKPYTKILSKS